MSDTPSTSEGDSNLETSRFASETLESERESLNAYKQATANAKGAPQIVIDPPGIQGHGDADAIRTDDEQSMYFKKKLITFDNDLLIFYLKRLKILKQMTDMPSMVLTIS